MCALQYRKGDKPLTAGEKKDAKKNGRSAVAARTRKVTGHPPLPPQRLAMLMIVLWHVSCSVITSANICTRYSASLRLKEAT